MSIFYDPKKKRTQLWVVISFVIIAIVIVSLVIILAKNFNKNNIQEDDTQKSLNLF